MAENSVVDTTGEKAGLHQQGASREELVWTKEVFRWERGNILSTPRENLDLGHPLLGGRFREFPSSEEAHPSDGPVSGMSRAF